MDPPGALKLAADIWQYPRKANRNTHKKTYKNRIQIQISRKVGNHQLHFQHKAKQNQSNRLLIAYFKIQTKLRNEIHWIERLAVASSAKNFKKNSVLKATTHLVYQTKPVERLIKALTTKKQNKMR